MSRNSLRLTEVTDKCEKINCALFARYVAWDISCKAYGKARISCRSSSIWACVNVFDDGERYDVNKCRILSTSLPVHRSTRTTRKELKRIEKLLDVVSLLL